MDTGAQDHDVPVEVAGEDPGAPEAADADPRLAELEEGLAKAGEEIAALKQQRADLDNMRKAIQADYEALEKSTPQRIDDAVAKTIGEFLAVYDSLDGARKELDKEGRDPGTAGKTLEAVAGGIEATVKQLDSLLEGHGMEPMKIEIGSPYDPNLHEPLPVESDLPADCVVRVLRKGYISHGRIVRTALVEVSKEK